MTLDEAIKHCEEVAEEKENEAQDLEYSKLDWRHEANKCSKCAEEHRKLATWLKELKQLKEQMSSSEKPNKWIPLTKRPMTEKEREEYEGIIILNCPLPEDGEEVLISYGGYVSIDTFHDDDGCYFEDAEIDDVEAWMPLPPSYKPQESEEENG